MRPALRGAIAGAIAAGMTVSTLAVAVPAATAADGGARVASTVHLSVVYTGKVGRTCTVGATVRTADGQVKGLPVTIQRSRKGKWVKLATVTSKRTKPAKAGLKTVEPVTFRAVFAGTTTVAADVSNRVTCKPVALAYGSKSASVKKLQKKLKKLRIRPASTTGTFDGNTLQAVYAFQKSTGIKRTGVVTSKVYAKIMKTKRLKAPSWCGSSTTMCIDLSQQVGYLKVGTSSKSHKKRYVVPVASGGNYWFYNKQTKVQEFAKTPTGKFRVYFKKPGQTDGPLGTYFWMSFFTGGYGVHGSNSVPTSPASHGCVRVPRTIEQWVYGKLPVGAGVHVHR
jgi:peptidoglycan hydrolase-like protein with peptidoglycan-binding domain